MAKHKTETPKADPEILEKASWFVDMLLAERKSDRKTIEERRRQLRRCGVAVELVEPEVTTA